MSSSGSARRERERKRPGVTTHETGSERKAHRNAHGKCVPSSGDRDSQTRRFGVLFRQHPAETERTLSTSSVDADDETKGPR